MDIPPAPKGSLRRFAGAATLGAGLVAVIARVLTVSPADLDVDSDHFGFDLQVYAAAAGIGGLVVWAARGPRAR
jgi:hypothetical protein